MRHNESMDNFEKWKDQWEKAMDDGVFDDAPRPAFLPPEGEEDQYTGFFTNQSMGNKKDVDAEYWNKMNKSSGYTDPLDEPHDLSMQGQDLVPISEDAEDDSLVSTEKPDGKSNRKITDELGPTPNPTNATNRGVDNRSHVTPNWAGGKKIVELHNMKLNLQKLEDKLAVDPMMEDKKSKSVASQIEALWRRIDQLSNSLSPDYTTEYQD